MTKTKRNSKKWLSHRRSVVDNYRHWRLVAVVKLLLVMYLVVSIRFFFIGLQSDVPLARNMAICLMLHILILGIVIKEFHEIQYSEQLTVSEYLIGHDTFHCLEIIPGKAFRIHFKENRIYKQRISRFKKLIRESRRLKRRRVRTVA